jgi:Phage integrase family
VARPGAAGRLLATAAGRACGADSRSPGPRSLRGRITNAKSRAGNRTVTFPAEIVPHLRSHLDRYSQPGPRGLAFVGPKAGKLRRNNFNPIWRAACVAAGVPDAHFHDLRHTGGTAAATTGATIKELMARLGHSSPRAAMIYQHATRDRDKAIADALGQLADKARAASSGPAMARLSTREGSESARILLVYQGSGRRCRATEPATGIEPA